MDNALSTFFDVHNQHLKSVEWFEENDPQLSRLKKLPFCYEGGLLAELPEGISGIYSIGGGRQVGKSTLLKQWMLKLLKNNTPAAAIYYFTGEVILDHHVLISLLQETLKTMPSGIKYLLIDEVTYIKDWDKAVKFMADAGFLDQVVLMITGSELVFIQEARMRFPGRRGMSDRVDFHLYPLSFREFLTLTAPSLRDSVDTQGQMALESTVWESLELAFDQYLLHGGYLTAINDFTKNKNLSVTTLNTYADWIRGDMLKRGKQEQYLKEVMMGLFKSYGTQITWNALAKSLSIDHPSTVADYVQLLEMMDAVFIQYALMEDKLIGAPKKARKVIFTDPFIYHAVWHWVFKELPDLERTETLRSKLIESVCISHFRRYFQTFYIKAEGEVDIAYIDQRSFHPIEVKWTEQIRPKDLKQILKYSDGKIWLKQRAEGKIGNTPVSNVIYNLARMGLTSA